MYSETQIPTIMRHEFSLFGTPEGMRNYEQPMFKAREPPSEKTPEQERMPSYKIISDGKTIRRVPY